MTPRMAQRAVWGVCAWMIGTALAAADPVQTIKRTGPPSERIDIVVLGDGYTRADLDAGKFRRDAQAFVDKVLAEQPYAEYQRLFNVHRVDVVSAQSGADHPETGTMKDTAFDATYNCRGIVRLICIDTAKVNAVLQTSIPTPNMREFAVVIVNDAAYGGSGGVVPVTSTNPAAGEIVLHEMGHSLALLGDEYVEHTLCDSATEPSWPNVTKERRRGRIKWRWWIARATPVPTRSMTLGVPGLYEGGGYCAAGLYRPTFDSKMRSVGRPFEQVNSEEHIKRFYNFVSPLAKPVPNTDALTLAPGSRKTFSARVQRPMTGQLEVLWYLDGVQVSRGTYTKSGWFNRFVLDTGTLSAGVHRLRVVVRDATALVRRDSGSVLVDEHTWTLTLGS